MKGEKEGGGKKHDPRNLPAKTRQFAGDQGLFFKRKGKRKKRGPIPGAKEKDNEKGEKRGSPSKEGKEKKTFFEEMHRERNRKICLLKERKGGPVVTSWI